MLDTQLAKLLGTQWSDAALCSLTFPWVQTHGVHGPQCLPEVFDLGVTRQGGGNKTWYGRSLHISRGSLGHGKEPTH